MSNILRQDLKHMLVPWFDTLHHGPMVYRSMISHWFGSGRL